MNTKIPLSHQRLPLIGCLLMITALCLSGCASDKPSSQQASVDGSLVDANADGSLMDAKGSLAAAIAGLQRTPAFVERDSHRHPQQTLQFFQVSPEATVIEIWPGLGWYTEILAPYLAPSGHFYAAHFPAETPVAYFRKYQQQFADKLASDSVYSATQLTEFHPPSEVSAGPAGSATHVLTFRNVHNWMKAGYGQQAFDEFFRLLRPGGVLGVVEHRAKPGTDLDIMIASGYVTQAHVEQLARRAGFVLEESSEINANPADNSDHPAGVWSLPPTLRLGEQDRQKYIAIGESDRMTLRFRKPLPVRRD